MKIFRHARWRTTLGREAGVAGLVPAVAAHDGAEPREGLAQ